MVKSLLSLVAAVVVMAGFSLKTEASPPGGSLTGTKFVASGSSLTHPVTLYGGESTCIKVEGNGRSCLEVRVRDENGNLVASNTIGLGDSRTIYLTPRWTGKFYITVSNIGPVSNIYGIDVY